MKWRNGVPFRKFRGHSGRIYWVQMSMAEVAQRDLYWITVVLTQVITIVLMAWAAGMI